MRTLVRIQPPPPPFALRAGFLISRQFTRFRSGFTPPKGRADRPARGRACGLLGRYRSHGSSLRSRLRSGGLAGRRAVALAALWAGLCGLVNGVARIVLQQKQQLTPRLGKSESLNDGFWCGYSTMVVQQPSKLRMPVRSRLPAPIFLCMSGTSRNPAAPRVGHRCLGLAFFGERRYPAPVSRVWSVRIQ